MPTRFYQTPGIDPYLDSLSNYRPNLGPQGKADKKFGQDVRAGKDISSFGFLNTIRQAGTRARADIGDRYMSGGNALFMNAGGPDAMAMNRMQQYELDRQRQQEGDVQSQALASEMGASANRLQGAYFNKAGLDLEARRAALMGKIGSNQLVKTDGWLDNLLKFSNAFASFTGGANNAAQAGGFGGYGGGAGAGG